MMNDFIDVSSKELIVRKRIANFIEKILKYYGYDFYHDDYKRVVYSEMPARTIFEIKAKAYYDAYMYLLENRKSVLTINILKKFFYIALEELIVDDLLKEVSINYYFYKNDNLLESAIYLQTLIYNMLIDKKMEIKVLMSLMFFNYELVRNNIPTTQFRYEFLQQYEKLMESSNQYDLYSLFKECLNFSNFQDKSYYLNLINLSQNDIVEKLLTKVDVIRSKFYVKNLYIFGSFAKMLERIDSDIDFLVKYSLDLEDGQKEVINNELKKFLISMFKRFVDLKEITVEINDGFIIKNPQIIKII